MDEAEAERYLENRRAKGFTVIQAVILAELDGLNTPNRNDDRPLLDNDPTRPNPKYFEWVDKVIRMAESKGLYIGLLPTWGDKVDKQWGVGPVIFTEENAFAYGEWLGDRYKDFPNIIWINGGDRLGGEDNYPIWNALARGIRKADKNHLMSFHPTGEHSSSEWFHDAEWLDFNMAQTGHCQRGHSVYERIIRKDYERVPTKPCMDSEPRYENHPVCWKPDSLGWFDAVDVRQALYWNLFEGALGHTYGCHDIWQMKSPAHEAIGLARGYWYSSLDLEGAADMIHARRLMESLSWEERRPCPEIILSENDDPERKAVALRGKDYLLIYIPDSERITCDLGALGEGERLSAEWMNPRDGTFTKAGEVEASDAVTFTTPSSGRGNDWLLLLRR